MFPVLPTTVFHVIFSKYYPTGINGIKPRGVLHVKMLILTDKGDAESICAVRIVNEGKSPSLVPQYNFFLLFHGNQIVSCPEFVCWGYKTNRVWMEVIYVISSYVSELVIPFLSIFPFFFLFPFGPWARIFSYSEPCIWGEYLGMAELLSILELVAWFMTLEGCHTTS